MQYVLKAKQKKQKVSRDIMQVPCQRAFESESKSKPGEKSEEGRREVVIVTAWWSVVKVIE